MGRNALTKTCSSCKEVKELSFFGVLRSSNDGLNHRCKSCMKQANIVWSSKNPERTKNLKRKSWLKRNYGITLEFYDYLVDLQGDTCGICGKNEKGANRGYWCVDHDHRTGTVRGLLCAPCNKALGQIGDTEESLEKALTYLRKTQNNQDNTH